MTKAVASAPLALMVAVGLALHLDAQPGPPSGPASVAQIAYLKASNPDAADHFGCGGLQGHTGQGVAISADGNTLAVGALTGDSAATRIESQRSAHA